MLLIAEGLGHAQEGLLWGQACPKAMHHGMQFGLFVRGGEAVELLGSRQCV
jgi:hypothetical protein